MKVDDIIQYYAYEVLAGGIGCLGLGLGGRSV